MASAEAVRVILCTCPPGEAERVARSLLEPELVACVNIIPGLRSLYRWDGAIQDDAEVLLVMKTRATLFSRLEARIREVHPYKVPEILGLDVAEGSLPYLQWVVNSTAMP